MTTKPVTVPPGRRRIGRGALPRIAISVSQDGRPPVAHRRGRRLHPRIRGRTSIPCSPDLAGLSAKTARPPAFGRSSAGGEFAARLPRRVMTDAPATLLLVEDDPLVRTFLADNLSADGYDVL